MNSICPGIFLLLCLVSYVLATNIDLVSIPSSIVFKSAHRSIDISKNVEEQIINYSLNIPDDKFFLFPIHSSKVENVALVEAISKSTKMNLPVSQVHIKESTISLPEGTRVYKVDLSSLPTSYDDIIVSIFYTHTLTPFPKKITQLENQNMLYNDHVYIYSLHPIASQTSSVKLYNSRVNSVTPSQITRHNDGVVTVGPFPHLIPALSTGDVLSIHSQNNFPFATVKDAIKEYEVSQWGSISVNEKYLLTHTGASLTGGFLRSVYETSMPPYGPRAGPGIGAGGGGPASFHSVDMHLPSQSKGIYFRDHIGNVSTTHVSIINEKTMKIQAKPRYPLFGGWSTDIEVGYNYPISSALSTIGDSDDFILELPFGVTLQNVAADELTIRVILPEGARDVRWKVPFEVDQVVLDSILTYLDVEGRTVVELSKKNVVQGHFRSFHIMYTFSSVNLLRKPLVLVAAFFGAFLLVMICIRLDFNLNNTTDMDMDAVPYDNGSDKDIVETKKQVKNNEEEKKQNEEENEANKVVVTDKPKKNEAGSSTVSKKNRKKK